MQPDVAEQVVRDKSSGRFHLALRERGKEPMLHDACNVVGEREYMDDLPKDVADSLLCLRCFGGK